MKVVCIDNELKRSSELVKPIKLTNLTIGKVYESPIVGLPGMWSIIGRVAITCDDGIVRDYSTTRFIALEEWREIQLNKIGLQ
jgi:hypothetical protein